MLVKPSFSPLIIQILDKQKTSQTPMFTRFFVLCVRRFELPTFWSVAKRSIQLSYAHIMPQTGIEPVREYKSRRILSPVRLPVPPLRHNQVSLVVGPTGLEPVTPCL